MTKQDLQEETEVQQPKPVTLNLSAMKPAEARRNSWSVVIPSGTTKEQLLQSQTWAVLSERFNFLDRLEVAWADRSAYAELLVLAAGRGHATLHLLHFHALPALLTADPGALPSGFECTFTGPIANGKGGYEIVRTVDSVVIVTGHSSREAALAELLQHASLR